MIGSTTKERQNKGGKTIQMIKGNTTEDIQYNGGYQMQQRPHATRKDIKLDIRQYKRGWTIQRMAINTTKNPKC